MYNTSQDLKCKELFSSRRSYCVLEIKRVIIDVCRVMQEFL
jgi:hypothetical protein